MFRKIKTATLVGIDAQTIILEADIQPGLPGVHLVGLADTTIREARERIRAAIVNSGYQFPRQRVTISLSPAGIPKEGSHFDLPMAIGVLGSLFSRMETEQTGFIGELSLDGTVKGVRGALPLAMSMRQDGIKKIVLPAENAQEVSLLKDVEMYPVATLRECMEFLNGRKEISIYKRKEDERHPERAMDFAEVKGNEAVKRGLVVAAAGGHGVLMIGSPGCGKTMMAKRMPYILPEMDYDEKLEVARIHSAAGHMDSEYIMDGRRPFRAPHYTITKAALIGGGPVPRPGEISLAHNGVLFLDELGEFDPAVIELLRGPLEDGSIQINRAKMEVGFPCRLMLVAAANPCKCGYLEDENHICTCTARQLENYYSRFSGPMLDRIDMHLAVRPVSEEILKENPSGMSTAEMKAIVTETAEIQRARYKGRGILFNSRLQEGDLEEFCRLGKNGETLLRAAYTKFGMSMRAYNKILKVARTIADIAKSEDIKEQHVAEALSYRALERFYRK